MFALFSSIFDSCVSASNFLNTKILKFLPCFSGERPFICELCGNSYTDIKNLKKHKTKVHSGTDKNPDCSVDDHAVSEQDSVQRSPLSETLDVKPSDMTLPLALPLGTEDHQMLLPVTDSQSPASDTLLRSTVNGYSEPQLIFLQQLY